MKKTFLKLTVLALAGALALAACGDAETGPAGTPGIQGPQGLPGGAGVMVYDSSATPQLLGYLLSSTGTTPYVLSPTGYVVQYNETEPSAFYRSAIYFTSAGQGGDPIVISLSFSKRVFYNPHSGGTFYTYTSGFPADTATGYQSVYFDDGTNYDTSSFGTYYKLNPGVADSSGSRATFGIPAVITRPFQYSTAVLE